MSVAFFYKNSSILLIIKAHFYCQTEQKNGGIKMADSNITKRALAMALKELMEEVPFDKINVAHICEKCHMNRKSFYYHFKDKYDLVNWIYDTEFIDVVDRKRYSNGWEFLNELCDYLYDNRMFYRKALKIKGQNSFSDHFREMLVPIMRAYMKDIFSDEDEDLTSFQVNFLTDGFICAIERWLQDREIVSSDVFVHRIRESFQKAALKIYKDINKE